LVSTDFYEIFLESVTIFSALCCHVFYQGVEVLNNAIETLHSSIPVEKWTYVNVTVAPSSITITNHEVASCTLN